MTVLMLRRPDCIPARRLEETARPGHLRITWMKTVLNDLESHNLTLTEAVNMAQNHLLWRLLAMSGLCTLSGED